MHRRGALLSVLLSLSFVFSLVSPAHAASTGWDPNDVDGRLDLRWVGVYQQDAGTARVAITLWDPVRNWMLPFPRHWRQLLIYSTGIAAVPIYGNGYIFFDAEENRWVMDWIDAGSAFGGRYRVAHPNPYLFQVWVPAEWASGFSVVSCDEGRPNLNEGCHGPSHIADRIPSNPLLGLDPA